MVSGVPITEASQPALRQLVTEVARWLDLPPDTPARLTLEPEIAAGFDARRTRRLSIGLPLLACLNVAEVRALVGHELTLLHRPDARQVIRTLARRSQAVLDEEYEDGRARRRARATRRKLDPLAAEVQHGADGAAITAAGGREPAARAFALAGLVQDEYVTFMVESGVPPYALRLFEAGISDLDDGWRRTLRRGVAESLWDADAAALLATVHPRLAETMTALGAGPLPLAEAARPVPVSPLTVREQRRLVRELRAIDPLKIVRWTTFQDAPASWWRRRAAKYAKSVRADVATLLGREPVDDVETIGVLRSRGRELTALAFGVPVEEVTGDAGPDEPQMWLLEDHLLRRGWRLEHPAVRGVLVAPDGRRVDGYEVLGTGVDPAAVRELLG
ncbi:hypothetical protein AB0I61_28515 [Polymorphospora rubra]|uniref:hypothetical protein n=1 Tax=Polymorphospora rubra TaxID=338584 RepID=UPI0033FDB395